MITNIKKPLALLLLVAVVGSCSKQKGFGPNFKDYSGGNTPVVITNAVDYRPDPTVTVSLAGDSSITVVLSIPASSGRTIKEITKVAASSSYAAIQSTGATGFYNVPVIPGNGKTVTFTTSIGAYLQQFKTEKLKVNTELVNRFYFRITLDDGSIVYPTPVRVIVVS